jgi:ATP-dependent Clp protease ATP-binding subunit ClpB
MNELTHLAQESLQKAQELRDKNRDSELTSLHVACGVLRAGFDVLDPSLRDSGIEPSAFIEDLESAVARLPRVEGDTSSGQADRVSPDVHRVLRGAEAIAREMGDSFITVEHLLLSLAGRAEMFELKSVLQKHGVVFDSLKGAIMRNRNSGGNGEGPGAHSANAENEYNVLQKYGQELVALAREGKLDPVIGREEEIRRVVRILSRKTKNNPVLVGEPGVGKTASSRGWRSASSRATCPSR